MFAFISENLPDISVGFDSQADDKRGGVEEAKPDASSLEVESGQGRRVVENEVDREDAGHEKGECGEDDDGSKIAD